MKAVSMDLIKGRLFEESKGMDDINGYKRK